MSSSSNAQRTAALADVGAATPLRVLHLITGLDIGGAEQMLLRLIQAHRSLPIESAVVSLTSHGVLGAEISKAGVPVSSLGMSRGIPNPAAFYRAVRTIRKFSPDVVQTWLYHADLLGALVGPLCGSVPVLWNIRCSELDPGDHSRTLNVLRKLLAVASRGREVVVSNSTAGQQAHEAIGYRPKHWEIIPNGFDTSVFRPSPVARAAIRGALRISEDTIALGIVARVHPMKDHGGFLKAAALIGEARPDVRFILVGRGTDCDAAILESVRALALGHRVHLLGERSDIPHVLASLDVLVSSSYSEAFPNVIAEGMACGVPCVATDVGDSAAIIGSTGILVPARDPSALANGVLKLLSEPHAEVKARGAAARERIVSSYSLESVAKCYERLYADVVRRRLAQKRLS